MRKMQLPNNQKGQLVVEAVLLIALLMGIAAFMSKEIQERGIGRKLVTSPWQRLSGMVECGVWEPCLGKPKLHPSSRDRNISLDPRANP